MRSINKGCKIILITGGSGSGKSAFGEKMACEIGGNEKKYYIATMQPFDKECRKRIEQHREMRKGRGFETIEQYRNIEEAGRLIEEKVQGTAGGGATVLVECMSNLLANEMYTQSGEKTDWTKVCNKIMKGIEELLTVCENIVIISNEVFSDGCGYDEDTLSYIEKLGEINTRIARMAEQVYEVVCGLPMRKK